MVGTPTVLCLLKVGTNVILLWLGVEERQQTVRVRYDSPGNIYDLIHHKSDDPALDNLGYSDTQGMNRLDSQCRPRPVYFYSIAPEKCFRDVLNGWENIWDGMAMMHAAERDVIVFD